MRDARAGRSKQSPLGCATVRFTQPTAPIAKPKKDERSRPLLVGFISASPAGATASDAVFVSGAQGASGNPVNGQNGCHETFAHRHLHSPEMYFEPAGHLRCRPQGEFPSL